MTLMFNFQVQPRSIHLIRIISCTVSALMLLICAMPTLAAEEVPKPDSTSVETSKPLPDRFMLRVGGYYAQDANTLLRLDTNSNPAGATIDFDRTLGGETEATVVRVDGLFRFNDHHALGASWYRLNFNGLRTIDRDLEWGDQIYPINTTIDSELTYDIYKLDYRYSLFHNEKAELGASLGLNIMKIAVNMSGSIGGVPTQSSNKAVTAPLPVWGLFAGYDFTPKLTSYYTYQLFNISYDDTVKGGLQDFLIGLEYRVIRNVGLGVAYNRVNANLEIKDGDQTLTYDTKWNGFMLYGSVYF